MALKVLQSGIEPLGDLDLYDAYMDSVLGGEIGTVSYTSRTNTASERAAFDVMQKVTNTTDNGRLVITTNIAENGLRPLWLLDDGSSGYGTLFGNIIGVPTGLETLSTFIGPPTISGSGKITVWDKPGKYGVTLDAVDSSATLGLQPTNSSLRPGVALYPMSNGKLTPTASRSAGGAIGADVVARFLEFCLTSNSIVTTPASLVGAANSYAFVVISYNVEG